MINLGQSIVLPNSNVASRIATITDNTEIVKQKPWEFAHVHIVTGEQKSGKNATCVARVRDHVYNDCVKNYLKEVKGINAVVPSVYDDISRIKGIIVVGYDRKTRVAKLRQGLESRLIKIPETYKLHSDIKVYSLFHLYGIPCNGYYCNWEQVITGLNNDSIRDAFLLLDQYEIVGSSREGMANLSKYLYKKSGQLAKRHLETYVLVPFQRMADWTMRQTATEIITCRHIDGTDMTNLKIQRRGLRGIQDITFHAGDYFRNYDADEEIPLPTQQVVKAMEVFKENEE